MNTTLWIGQALLGATFLYSGICKSILSEQQLIAKGQTGVVGLSPLQIRSIGILEILGSAGVILPWLMGVYPVLTPVSALCFGILMILAAPIHYRLHEPKNVAVNMTLLAISLFVAWGRF